MVGSRLTAPAALGLVASSLVAVGSWTAGAPIYAFDAPTWLGLPQMNLTLAKVVFWCGLALLSAAWVWLRSRSRGLQPLLLIAVSLIWAAPLVIGPPLASRDAYSYAANGALAQRGLDPADHPPSQLWPGRLFVSVDPIWRDSKTPYGPLATGASRVADRIGNGRPVADVLVLRAEMIAGYLLLLFSARSLARSAGRDPTDAVVLIAANPLVLVHLIGGLHNESLMLGLMMGGLAVAARRPQRWAWVVGVCLTSAALAVKAPAALALGWMAWNGPGWMVAPARSLARRVADSAIAGVLALATITVLGIASGAGWGWIGNLDSANRVRGLLSVTTTAGIVVGHVFGAHRRHELTGYVTVARRLGQLLSAVTAVVLLLRRGDRLLHLATALLVFGALSPTVYPWYLLWGLPVLAVAWSGRAAAGLVVTSIALCFTVHPAGSALANNLASSAASDFRAWLALAIGVLAVVAWRLLRARPDLTGRPA